MDTVSYKFCDWVVDRIRNNLGEQVQPENVFDVRFRDLGQNIKMAVNKGLGVCIVVELGGITPQGTRPDDTQMETEVHVSVCHNASMVSSKAFDSRAFAEHLYRLFAGAAFEQLPGMPNNVRVGAFSSQGEDKMIHTFTVNHLTTL